MHNVDNNTLLNYASKSGDPNTRLLYARAKNALNNNDG